MTSGLIVSANVYVWRWFEGAAQSDFLRIYASTIYLLWQFLLAHASQGTISDACDI